VGNVGELREGTMKKVMVRGQAILIARVKGEYYAVDARCPHLEGDLSKGTLRDTILTCPMHHSQFDLQDGHIVRWTDLTGITFTIASQQKPPKSLKQYPVMVKGDKILIALE
jgi:3-phenylpropionate/trans-cinnamate dioxygenase ferredoxin subunit